MLLFKVGFELILFSRRDITMVAKLCLVGILMRVLRVVGTVGMCLCQFYTSIDLVLCIFDRNMEPCVGVPVWRGGEVGMCHHG